MSNATHCIPWNADCTVCNPPAVQFQPFDPERVEAAFEEYARDDATKCKECGGSGLKRIMRITDTCPFCKGSGRIAPAADSRDTRVTPELLAQRIAARAVQSLADSEPNADTIDAQERLKGTPQESLFCVSAAELEAVIAVTISNAMYDGELAASVPEDS